MVFPVLDYVYFALIRNIVDAQSETTTLEACAWPNLGRVFLPGLTDRVNGPLLWAASVAVVSHMHGAPWLRSTD